MNVKGSVDIVTYTEVRGWAYSGGRSDPVLVTAMLNHEILGEAIANIHRPDIEIAGIGDGKSGYIIKLFRMIDPLYFPFIVVKVDGGDAELPRAPMLGFSEFFASLYLLHPSAGRSRSVFGGLWTDRTDAAALLRGKTEIGQIPTATSVPLVQLVQDGFSVVDLTKMPSKPAGHDELVERIGEVVEDTMLLPLLRVVLDDNPLILKIDLVSDGHTEMAQPSIGNPSPSPAECLEVIVPLGDGVTLDVVRESHRLPEFMPDGLSRWANRGASISASLTRGQGYLDSVSLVAGKVAIVGPGTMRRVRSEAGAAAVRILCLPARGLPVSLAYGNTRRAVVRASGVRVWI